MLAVLLSIISHPNSINIFMNPSFLKFREMLHKIDLAQWVLSFLLEIFDSDSSIETWIIVMIPLLSLFFQKFMEYVELEIQDVPNPIDVGNQ